MRKLLLLPALLAALSPVFSNAESTPPPGKFDPRVRTVAYNAQDIVVVTTYPGVSTPIRFADDEAIEQESLDAGDRKAWSIKASARRNILFVRPIARMADTNMTVVTNKRVYLFLLNVLQEKEPNQKKDGKKAGKQATTYAATYSMEASRSKALTLSLTFTYPDAVRKNDAAKAADTLRDQMENAKRHAAGGDYWVAGDEEVSPTDARDDGRFIYLTFARNRSLPNITGIDSNGKPFALNPTPNGNTVIIDRLVRHLKLELGGAAACVVNRAFNPDGGTDNTTGTVAPNVIRVIKGDNK